MNGVGVAKHLVRLKPAGEPGGREAGPVVKRGLGGAVRRRWPSEVLAFGGMLLRSGGLLPVPVAATLLGVSRQRVYALMEQGILQREVVWGFVLVSYAELVAYAETARLPGKRLNPRHVKAGGGR